MSKRRLCMGGLFGALFGTLAGGFYFGGTNDTPAYIMAHPLLSPQQIGHLILAQPHRLDVCYLTGASLGFLLGLLSVPLSGSWKWLDDIPGLKRRMAHQRSNR